MQDKEGQTVDTGSVEAMARLSRLEVSEDEKALFARQFGDILAYMDVLAKVSTDGVEPLYSPAGHAFSARSDLAETRRKRADILACAPETDGTYFVVPRIV